MKPENELARLLRSEAGRKVFTFLWRVVKRDFFDVEFAYDGPDVVYHFFPARGKKTFPPGFLLAIEDGFRRFLPPTTDVRAKYYTSQEADQAGIVRAIDGAGNPSAQETCSVRVKNGLARPFAEEFLGGRIFDEISRAACARAAAEIRGSHGHRKLVDST